MAAARISAFNIWCPNCTLAIDFADTRERQSDQKMDYVSHLGCAVANYLIGAGKLWRCLGINGKIEHRNDCLRGRAGLMLNAIYFHRSREGHRGGENERK